MHDQLMNNLLANPAIISGILPLLTTFALASLLHRYYPRLTSSAFVVSFYLSVYLTTGLQFFPLTSTRKLLLMALFCVALGFILDHIKQYPPLTAFGTATLGAVAAAWVIWPVVMRSEGFDFWLRLIASLAYAGWMTMALQQLHQQPHRSAIATLALGLGLGVSAILGASALIGQLSIAIAAIAGAFLLMLLLNEQIILGSLFTLSTGLLIGLLGLSAVLYAKLPWYCLIPLVAVPGLVRLPIQASITNFKKLLWLTLFTIPLSLISIIIAWISTNSGDYG